MLGEGGQGAEEEVLAWLRPRSGLSVPVLVSRAVLQELHRACELAAQGGHIPGGPALAWAQEYAAALDSEQSCLNEWLAMADLESVRPGSPLPTEPTERAVRALLRDVLTSADLETVTSKEVSACGGPGGGGARGSRRHPSPLRGRQVRTELERRMGHSLEQHKDFIDNEMLLVLAQMDRPSRVFPHIYLVGMGRAVGYRYSRPSHSITAVVGLRVECGQPGGAAAELVSRGGRGGETAAVVGDGTRARPQCLMPHSVTHILNVAREIDNFFPALFHYMNVRVYDEETAQLLPHWNDTFLFLSDIKLVGAGGAAQCGGGGGGISRWLRALGAVGGERGPGALRTRRLWGTGGSRGL